MAWTNFRTYFETIGPPWTHRYYGERLWGALGLMCDLVAEGATQAVRASWLKADTFPADALPIIGHERQIERVQPDTNAAYRTRLMQAWDLWTEAGTPGYGGWVFEPWGIADADVYARAQAPDGWCVGSPTADISRFSLLVDDPSPAWTQALWGTAPPTWGIGWTWGSSATLSDIQAVYKLVWAYKAAHEVPIMVVLAWGDCWGWGAWGTGTWLTESIYWEMGQYWGGSTGHRHFDVWGGVSAYDADPAVWGTRLYF